MRKRRAEMKESEGRREKMEKIWKNCGSDFCPRISFSVSSRWLMSPWIMYGHAGEYCKVIFCAYGKLWSQYLCMRCEFAVKHYWRLNLGHRKGLLCVDCSVLGEWLMVQGRE